MANEKIKIFGVIGYPNLTEKSAYRDPTDSDKDYEKKLTWNCSAMIEDETQIGFALLKKAYDEELKKLRLRAVDRKNSCFNLGKDNPNTPEDALHFNKYVLQAKTKNLPFVGYSKRGTIVTIPLEKRDEVVEAGQTVALTIQLWSSDKNSATIGANLIGVQLMKKVDEAKIWSSVSAAMDEDDFVSDDFDGLSDDDFESGNDELDF